MVKAPQSIIFAYGNLIAAILTIEVVYEIRSTYGENGKITNIFDYTKLFTKMREAYLSKSTSNPSHPGNIGPATQARVRQTLQ